MKSFLNSLCLLFSYNLYFKIPTKKNYCIFDDTDKKSFQKILNYSKIEYLKANSLNIYIILKLIFKNPLDQKNFMLRYLIKYIECIQPKFFITKIDNFLDIWKIKKKFPNIKVIIIQNGWRMKKNDIFGNLKKNKEYQCDFFLTFNQNIAKIYSKFIKAKFITLGSLINNRTKVKNFPNNKSICFISEYIGGHNDENFKSLGTNFYQYYKPEFLLLKFLKEYCLKNKYNFIVYPRTFSKNEYLFYKKILGDNDWKFVDKEKNCAYHETDKSSVSISISSTLGYEALARGNKVIFFSCRKTRGVSASFGWPKYHRKKEGFFWINYINLKKFEKKLNNIKDMSKYEWKFKSAKYKNNIMFYNKNNSILKQILKKN